MLYISPEAFALDPANEDLGETRLGRGTAGGTVSPACGVVNGEGGLVEITLELESGLLNEAFVVRIVRDRGQLADGF
jgi:hypothetical protein